MRSRSTAVLLSLLTVGCGALATPPSTSPSSLASARTAEPSPAASSTALLPAASPMLDPTASPPAATAAAMTTSPPPFAAPTTLPAPTAATPSSVPSAIPSPPPATTAAPSPDAIAGRNFADRPDDFGGAQVHYMYVLPSDGRDERLDVNGAIATSVASIQVWLSTQTGGRHLRVDTFQGSVDVTFYRLHETDAQIAGSGAYVRDRIEAELKGAGLTQPGKLYAVFYGGGSSYACGGGAWPPVLPGIVAAQYLKGTPPGATCASNPVGASATAPGYEDFAMLHELLHTMGLVAPCAPHFTAAGHVSSDPRDLMYAGPLPWRPSLLDVARTDYYGHNIPGCPDLGRLPWLS